MARYIDAERLVEQYERAVAYDWNKKTSPSSWADAYDCVIADIDEQPTADVVEVVRCKDCICYKANCCFHPQWDMESATEVPLVREIDFCSYGERKEANK